MVEILVIVLVFSIGLVGVVAALARWRPNGDAAIVASLLFLAFSCAASFSMALMVQGLLTAGWAMACAVGGWRPRAYLSGAVASATIGWACATVIGVSAWHTERQLKAEFPIESLAPRLAYEQRADRPTAALVSHDSPHFAEMEQSLSALDERRGGSTRTMMLHRLHAGARRDFVLAIGFGDSRMGQVRRENLELWPEPEPLECPADPESEHPSDGDEADAAPPQLTGPPLDDLQTMHFDGLDQLFDARWLGYVAGNQQAAGFASHRFVMVPSLHAPPEATTTWQVVRLELVSLLKYDRPMVYSSAELPRMDALEAMPRRELVEFETGALDRLREGEDVVFESAGNQIQMLGSLRAARDCLDCHTAQRGELLGALSYELLPAVVAQVEETP